MVIVMSNDKNMKFEEYQRWIKLHDDQRMHAKSPGKIIKKDRVDLNLNTKEHFLTAKSEKIEHQTKSPQIEYLEKEGILTGVEITCTCGQVIHIDFTFDEQQDKME